MNPPVNRRQALGLAGSVAAGLACASKPVVAQPVPVRPHTPETAFSYCLNTATIRSHKLPLGDLVTLLAEAGYDGIEPWVRDIRQYEQDGGNLRDLGKHAADSGLEVVNMIGFAQWAVDDDTKRAKGLEDLKRDMALAANIGCKRIAAPPAGATRQALELPVLAARYRKVLELGEAMGVIPQLELWGSSLTLSRLGELAFVAVEAGHPSARVLPDVYHIYKGGSDFAGLRLISGTAMDLFHINDYPATPPREQANDGDRIFPGDGVAPLGEILRTIYGTGFRGQLSLELFNREYWKQDPGQVARRGLAKMKQAVQEAFA